MSKEIVIKENYNLEKIKDMNSMANVLKAHVVKNKLYTNIKGKNYAHVEGWQFAGGLMGLRPRVVAVHDLSTDKELKWKADVELILMKDDKVVANGFALCSSKEANKKNFDEYAVLSMAQTRAIGKAYRNLVGWVMKLAGYEGTPSEEMRKVDEAVKEPVEPTVSSQEGSKTSTVDICSAKDCGRELTQAEAHYSNKMFNKKLCRQHQPKKR